MTKFTVLVVGATGAGQGLSQGPLTAEGLIGVAGRDAGAASGITYVASQVGTSLALAIQTVVFAAAAGAGLAGTALLTHRIAALAEEKSVGALAEEKT